MRGLFITLEGIDGAGKSSHIPFIQNWAQKHAISLYSTREPGGTDVGEALRALLLSVKSNISLETETLLMFASRQELVSQQIRPKLEAGIWVLSDRFSDSTYAFQGGGRGVDFAKIEALEEWVHEGLQPDLTFLFDVPESIAQQRMQGERSLDRFEREAADFHTRVRNAYLKRASKNERIIVLDASLTIAQLQIQIEQHLNHLLLKTL